MSPCLAIVFGQGLMLGSLPVLAYGVALWVAFHLFVVAYEEPTLQHTYGAEYSAYRSAVPRWIPRATPARPPTDAA